MVATANKHIMVIGETATPGFQLISDHDLTVACPAMDKLTSALPDYTGRIWFVSFNGWVGTLDLGSGTIHCVDLAPVEAGHLPTGKTTAEIENSFAIEPDRSGVYIASETAMYRFDALMSGAPAITWQKYYDRVDVNKPGQVDTGSGTTPTLMGSDLVSITDNADPMDIVVYSRSDGTLMCKQPVFNTDAFKLPAGSAVNYASDSENSLIGTDTSMVVENNYGYSSPTATSGGAVTYPGLERVDMDSGGGCHALWTSMERAPRWCRSCRWPTGCCTRTPSRRTPGLLHPIPRRAPTRGFSPRWTSAPARRCGRGWPGWASATTTTTPRSPSARMARRTSGCWVGWPSSLTGLSSRQVAVSREAAAGTRPGAASPGHLNRLPCPVPGAGPPLGAAARERARRGRASPGRAPVPCRPARPAFRYDELGTSSATSIAN